MRGFLTAKRVFCARLTAMIACALLVSVILPAGALALTQRGHVLGSTFAGKGKAELSDPLGVAVDDATGNVYVANYGKKRVVELAAARGGEEVKFVRVFGEQTEPTAIAVDDCMQAQEQACGDTEDPSVGDVYVAGGKGGDVVYKFSAEGALLEKIKAFDGIPFGAVEGVAVDSAGGLFVWQQDGTIDRFSDASVNQGVEALATGLKGAPGFAVGAEGDFFAGIEGGHVEELEGITGETLGEAELGAVNAVAVNTLDVPSNEVDERGDVYVDNLRTVGGVKTTAVDQLAPGEGGLLQTLEVPGLSEAGGVAVDDQTGAVFVTNAASGELDVFTLEPAGQPAIEGLQALGATPASPDARLLSAQVNPAGSATTYRFEYGSRSCGSAPGPCVVSPSVVLGEGFAGFGDRRASFEVSGLAPGTYHYRVIAENAAGASVGPEREFTVIGAVLSGLPDDRAWEMVSPPDKHGAPIEALTREGGEIVAAEDGSAFAYLANGAIEEEARGNRSFEPQQDLAVRGREGWVSEDIATPQERAAGANFGAPEYQFFSPDLSLALLVPFVPEPPLAPGVTGKSVYLRADSPIVPEASEAQSYAEAQEQAVEGGLAPGFLPVASATFLDGTPDLSSVVLEFSAGPSGPGLYEWSTGGSLRLVGELPGGGSAGTNASLGYYEVRAHAISNDGARVIWTASQETPGHLYLRDTVTEQTIDLDAAQGVSEPAIGAARFQTASTDASQVFFTDDQLLVNGASGEPNGERPESDLYVCELVETAGRLGCALQDLTIPLHAGEHAAVQGQVLGANEDGSSVFLVAQGVLAENENAAGETARSGQDNLYELQREGQVWSRTFIAKLSSEDAPDWDAGPNVSDENLAFQTAKVSPNGEYLAFMSQRGLTGYDNEDVSSKHPGERMDEEVYLYDTHTKDLTCVSCDPTGARPAGVLDQEASSEGIGLVVDRRESWRGQWLAGSIPGWTSESIKLALNQSRFLNDEGRLFFDGADPLVPSIAPEDRTREETVNGHRQPVGVENVYEYEPAGVGGCASGPTVGCVALISSGTSQKESAFLEATPSGDDVFFLTAAQLAPQDADDTFDIYDARVGGGFAAPSAPHVCRSVEECHSLPSSGPAAIGPSGSLTLSGAGNPLQPSSTATHEVTSVKKGDVKPLTRAQKLTMTLKACRKHYPHAKRRRAACEAHARALYGPKSKNRAKR